MSTNNNPIICSILPSIYLSPSKAYWLPSGQKLVKKRLRSSVLDQLTKKQIKLRQKVCLILLATQTLMFWRSFKILLEILSKIQQWRESLSLLRQLLPSKESTTKKDKELETRDQHCHVVTINGIAPANISVDQIQGFASQMGIKGL